MLLPACSKLSESHAQVGTTVSVSDPESGVNLSVRTNLNEMTIANRIRITSELSWAEDVDASFSTPIWDDFGWTLIEQLNTPVSTNEQGYFQSSTFVLEPFLPGEYAIPSIEVKIMQLDTEISTGIQSDPIKITVAGILAEDDAGELAEPDGFFDPDLIPVETEDQSSLYIFIGFAGFIIVVFIIWLLRSKSKSNEATQSIYQQLKSIAQSAESNDSTTYQKLYQAIMRLDNRLLQTSEFGTLVEQCEVAIYSQDGRSDLTPQAMAKHTLELLGSTEQEVA